MGNRLRRCMPALLVAAVLAAAPAASADSPTGGARAPDSTADTLGGATPPASGGANPTGSFVVGGQSGPTVNGKRAVLIRGTAYAPSQAPAAVKAVIWAANRIRHKPYKWGGGHGSWKDSGYDCSGSVSYALHGGGLLDSALDSRGFMRWGKSGAGHWITVYASNGHAYMAVAGLRFDTSGAGEHGPRWRPEPAWERNFTVRHPAGL